MTVENIVKLLSLNLRIVRPGLEHAEYIHLHPVFVGPELLSECGVVYRCRSVSLLSGGIDRKRGDQRRRKRHFLDLHCGYLERSGVETCLA